MILVINICNENLHYFEFVKPICDILDRNKIKYFVKHYGEISKNDLGKCSKVIICGTSLYDNEFVFNAEKFKWIIDFDKPILGICGGMQIIGLVFGSKISAMTEKNKGLLRQMTEKNKGLLRQMTEIGFYSEYFDKEFLGLKGKCEVYHLHNNYVDFGKISGFEVFCGKEFSQAVKHRKKEIYGVLFHPEVREKGLIEEFCLL